MTLNHGSTTYWRANFLKEIKVHEAICKIGTVRPSYKDIWGFNEII